LASTKGKEKRKQEKVFLFYLLSSSLSSSNPRFKKKKDIKEEAQEAWLPGVGLLDVILLVVWNWQSGGFGSSSSVDFVGG
jgi:hypothetical protein